MAELYRLRNQIKHYEWGSPDQIPRLLGLPGDGRPWAELWMGCHPGSPSQVSLPEGDVNLGELIAGDRRRYLGGNVAKRYGTLPFLFKLLAAEKPLSIQAHPNQAQAREGFDRETMAGLPPDAPERSYKDPNHKPEIICALTPFTGICGFRDPGEIRRLLAGFLGAPAVPARLRDGLSPLLQALQSPEPGAANIVLRNFTSVLFNLSPAIRQTLTEYVLSTEEPRRDGLEYEWGLMRNFARLYPGDPAIITPLYLNIFRLKPGEAIFLKAALLHSYIHGFGLELMANSDNVLRGGLTGKHIDVPELMRVLDFCPMKPEIIKPAPELSNYTYPAPCDEFSLTVKHGVGEIAAFSPKGPSICIVTEGEVHISGGGDLSLKQGESAFIPPACEGERPLVLRGCYTLYAASCRTGGSP